MRINITIIILKNENANTSTTTFERGREANEPTSKAEMPIEFDARKTK